MDRLIMDTILFIVMTDHDVRLAFYIGEVHYMEKRDGQLWPTDNFIEAGTQGFPPEWHALHARLHRERATPLAIGSASAANTIIIGVHSPLGNCQPPHAVFLRVASALGATIL